MKPTKTILKFEETEKEEPEQMTTKDFPPSFSQFKEGIQKINESKAPDGWTHKLKQNKSTYLTMIDLNLQKSEITGMKNRQKKLSVC